jgi:hypothetical protein
MRNSPSVSTLYFNKSKAIETKWNPELASLKFNSKQKTKLLKTSNKNFVFNRPITKPNKILCKSVQIFSLNLFWVRRSRLLSPQNQILPKGAKLISTVTSKTLSAKLIRNPPKNNLIHRKIHTQRPKTLSNTVNQGMNLKTSPILILSVAKKSSQKTVNSKLVFKPAKPNQNKHKPILPTKKTSICLMLMNLQIFPYAFSSNLI